MVVCKEGKVKAVIAADLGAHPLFLTAAKELAEYLKEICGDSVKIIDAAKEQESCEIVLAMNGRTLRKEMPKSRELKNDGFRIVTKDQKLFIISDNGRGILFGVYRFLEKYLGCGFYSSKVEKVPKLSNIELSDMDEVFISPYEYRENWWYEYEYDPIFAKKRGMNSSIESDMSEGGFDYLQYNGFAHTMFDYISPDEYYDEHPEYFSMVDGKRVRDFGQLCLTNPDVLRIFKKKLHEKIKAHPEKKIVSITQMDWYNYCTCPECKSVCEEEESAAGPYLRFVNECARSIKDEFPDVIIDTFAYQFTRSAPRKTKPESNVCVRICTIECCYKHSYAECNRTISFDEKHNSMTKDFVDWSKICNRIFVWDYSTNFRFYIAPFPNFQVLKKNNQFLIEHNTTGIFEQGNAQSVSGEFGELRGYLCSRLMWEPDLDIEKAREEFMRTYYGRGWEYIREYLDTLEKKVLEKEGHFGLYQTPEEYLPDDFTDFADPLFDKAEELAENEDVLWRIRKSRISVRFIKLRALPFNAPERDRLLTEFKNDMINFGITMTREGSISDGRDNSPESYVETWRKTPSENMEEFDKNRIPNR